MDRTAKVVADETALIREQLRRNDIGLITGEARFVDEHTLSIDDDGHDQRVSAENIVIAVGTCPARPEGVQFDDHRVIDSDGVLKLDQEAPRTMTVVGGGRDRRGVRVDVRGARHQGHARRRARPAAARSSTTRSAWRSSTCCGGAPSRSGSARR